MNDQDKIYELQAKIAHVREVTNYEMRLDRLRVRCQAITVGFLLIVLGLVLGVLLL